MPPGKSGRGETQDGTVLIRVAADLFPPSRHVTHRGSLHIVVISAIHRVGQSSLAEVVQATCLLRFCFRFGQAGQEHASEDRDNGNHHEQLNQSETIANGQGRSPHKRSAPQEQARGWTLGSFHTAIDSSKTALNPQAFRHAAPFSPVSDRSGLALRPNPLGQP